MARPTIYDIAKEAGVSPATVSRTLNQNGYVKIETRQRIEQAMRRLGYERPDRQALQRDVSTRTIGVLVPDIRYEHCAMIVFHIEAELSKRGYSCILCNANESHDKALRDINLLLRKKVEGLILVNSFFAEKPIRNWLKMYPPPVPVVMVHGALNLPNVYNIAMDMDRVTRNIIQRLLEKGKTHLVFMQARRVRGSTWLKTSIQRVAQEVFHFSPPLSITIPDKTVDAGYEAAWSLFQKAPMSNALIFDSSFPAIGACRYLMDSGIAVPQDVAILTAEMLTASNLVRPKLACVDTRQDIMGREAARAVLDLIDGLDRPHYQLMTAEILERETM